MPKRNNLEGLYFHTWDTSEKGKRELVYQGHVIEQVEPGYYLVQLYSALTGQPSTQHIYSINAMRNFTFYSSAEDWQAAAKRWWKTPMVGEDAHTI